MFSSGLKNPQQALSPISFKDFNHISQGRVSGLKSSLVLLSIVQRDMAWSFQMSYYTLSYLKGLQNCDLSKLEVQKSGVTPVQVE